MAQFRTKARALELLGKGQIADLPTAITELWKNGFDAYADKVTAEIYCKGYKGLQAPFFVITDDGKGMSNKDIFDKWLILGTDSKSRTTIPDNEGIETLFKAPRIKAGEKGIGRLSVAFMGPTMVMLTKKMGHPLQILFFDWRVLENYNLFLDDIQIPVIDFRQGEDFDTVFKLLKTQYLKNFEKEKQENGDLIWEKGEQEQKKQAIISSLNSLTLPDFFIEELVSDLTNIKEAHGTKFVIFNPEEQIVNLTNITSESEEENENDIDYVLKSLSGFTNQFKEKTLPLEITFPVHDLVGNDWDLLQRKFKFFSPDDFKLADIIIDGKFDGNGSFKGTLKFYDDKPFDYNYTASRRKDARNNYGEFELKLGYLKGEQVESKLEKGVFDKFNKKIKDIGALYLYRDGFRVLPYGRPDYDFLEFERRRTLRAGIYFFSYRRMFGYIELKRNVNENLKDKASREGLTNNAAFRNFKSDLESFFISLAKEFFSTNAKNVLFKEKTDSLRQEAEILKKDKDRLANEKRQFTRSLSDYPDRFKNFQNRYADVLNKLQEKSNHANVLYSEIEELLDTLKKLDLEYNSLLPEIPKRYKPTDTQLERLSKYESKLAAFHKSLKPRSNEILKGVNQKLQLKELLMDFDKNINLYLSDLEEKISTSKTALTKKFQQIQNELGERTNRMIDELKKLQNEAKLQIHNKADLGEKTSILNKQYQSFSEQFQNTITPLVEHISRLDFEIDEDRLQGVYKEQYDYIKYQWEQTREAAQLGIAVEIIDHEFNELYGRINSAISKLNNSFEKTTFNYLQQTFKQLEQKYSLLSPLYRIAGVIAREIKCVDLKDYIKRFFENRIIEEGIEIQSTKSFDVHVINVKEPIIHTALINVVNNAMYWMRNSEIKKILFDYNPKTEEIIIANSGQKIEDFRLSKVFELFYSTRPNGRGIGLYLVKQSLNENYFEIYATNDEKYNSLKGACFVIKPMHDK